ncbi:helix-turn-helix domain-containing protein [Evansella tamaricis]|nr:helix-turn-helix domain-containing protein [Evansella tamaricis]
MTKSQEEIIERIDSEFSKDCNISLLVPNKLTPQIELQDLYTLDEVAKILGKSLVTIRQYVREGKLKGVKKWRNWMIPSNEIARFLYESQIGVKLEKGTPILVAIVCMDIYENDIKFDASHLLTHHDIFNLITTEEDDIREIITKTFFPKLPTHSLDWIEPVSNIPHFFRRAGYLPYQDETNEITPLSIVFDQVKLENLKNMPFIKGDIDRYLNQPPKEATENILTYFSQEMEQEKLTPNITLKLYKALLELAKENKELSKKINERKDANG